MNLSFLHLELAGIGLALASIPVALHFLMRPRPKPVVFPAMQLLKRKVKTTTRQLKLRHWLLLLMRILILALLGLALARPTLRSSLLSIDQEAPVAAVVVVDNSPSMGYKEEGKTRLDIARELIVRALEKLPEGSDVTLLESAHPNTSVPYDPAGAIARLKKIDIQSNARPLTDSLQIALKSLAKSDKSRKEVYILTDMAASAWNLGDQQRLQELRDLIGGSDTIFVLNVGAAESKDVSIAEVSLSRQVLSENSPLDLHIALRNAGPDVDRTVTVTLDDEPRETKPVRLAAGSVTEVNVTIAGLKKGIHQGKIELSGADPLAFNDVHYFTVEARPALRILIVSDEPLDAINWANALSPEVLRREQRSRYQIETILSPKLAETDLANFDVVCLLNVGSPTQDVWLALSEYLNRGGGLFIGLGDHIDPIAYNSGPAQLSLPGKLDREEAPGDAVFLTPEKLTHPLLLKFRSFPSNDMEVLPVLRYWKVTLAGTGTLVVVPLSNGDPGIVERVFAGGSRGRVVMLTTAAHYRPNDRPWTEWPLGWSYLVMADQIAHYLAGVTEAKLNFVAGDNVTVELDPTLRFSLYYVTHPDKRVERLSVPASESLLTLPDVHEVGNYRVDAEEKKKSFTAGFSVNLPLAESDIKQLESDKLIEFLGEERVHVARDPEELAATVDQDRVGRELFSWLMFLVLAAIVAEGYISNRFYRRAS